MLHFLPRFLQTLYHTCWAYTCCCAHLLRANPAVTPHSEHIRLGVRACMDEWESMQLGHMPEFHKDRVFLQTFCGDTSTSPPMWPVARSSATVAVSSFHVAPRCLPAIGKIPASYQTGSACCIAPSHNLQPGTVCSKVCSCFAHILQSGVLWRFGVFLLLARCQLCTRQGQHTTWRCSTTCN